MKNDVPLIEAKNLKKYFNVGKNTYLHAVDDVSLKINEGTTVGLVGESGCGKSTLGRTILRLHEPTEGDLLYRGKSYLNLRGNELRDMRKKMQIIFQDPYACLNPRMSVSELIAEYMIVAKSYSTRAEIYKRTEELMDIVGLSKRVANAFPHELDGGRRQRIGIARALSVQPEFIVCDEPVSALDVSIQAQILNLFKDLQAEFGLTYLFVTHNLSVVKHISDEIVVMYLGQCVEIATTKELFRNPCHPYTKALFSAVPKLNIDYKIEDYDVIRGEVSNPINPKPGCRFASRCEYASEKCLKCNPPTVDVGNNHFVSCVLFGNA